MRSIPPTEHLLHTALAALPPGRTAAAATHLALPVDRIVGVHVPPVDHLPQWHDTLTGRDSVAAARALAADQHRAGDRYLPLDGDPAGWLKPRRSGTGIVLFGVDLLFDLPATAVDVALASELPAVIRLLLDGRFEVGGGPVQGVAATTTGQLRWLRPTQRQPAVA